MRIQYFLAEDPRQYFAHVVCMCLLGCVHNGMEARRPHWVSSLVTVYYPHP